MRTPATDIAGDIRRSVIPKVDFLGEAGDRGPKTLSKQKNISVLWAPHPTYDRKDINTTRQVDKIKEVGLVETERKKRSKNSVEPHPHFLRAVFLSGGTKKTDIVRPAGTIRKKQTAKVVNSLNEREETAAMGLKRIGEEKGDIATDEEEGFKEVGDLYPEFREQ